MAVNLDQSPTPVDNKLAGSAISDARPSVARAPFSFSTHWKACGAYASLSTSPSELVVARKVINFILWPARVFIFVLTLFVAIPLHYLKPHEQNPESVSAVAARKSGLVEGRLPVDVHNFGSANDSDRLVSFLGGVGDIAPGSDGKRYTVAGILALPPEKLESYHGFIQWIFPTDFRGHNPKAARASNELIEKLAADPELVAPLLAAWDTMASFWGFDREKQADGSCKFVCPKKERFLNKLTRGDHNMLRITRAMHSSLFLSSGRSRSKALDQLYTRAKAFAYALEDCCKSDDAALKTGTYLTHWRPLFDQFRQSEALATGESATVLESKQSEPVVPVSAGARSQSASLSLLEFEPQPAVSVRRTLSLDGLSLLTALPALPAHVPPDPVRLSYLDLEVPRSPRQHPPLEE